MVKTIAVDDEIYWLFKKQALDNKMSLKDWAHYIIRANDKKGGDVK
jgi:hypothetical protein